MTETYFKAIEAAQAPPVLPREHWWILRLDGRAFHTWTKKQGFAKPYDTRFMAMMDQAAVALCEEIQNARFAYVQSDEISVFARAEGAKSQTWFGGDLAKVLSISAAVASTVLTANRKPGSPLALFDSRIITTSNPLDVQRYLQWRQNDAFRNAVTMTAEVYFSHRELLGRGTRERLDMIHSKTGNMWSDAIPERFRRGRFVRPEHVVETVDYQHKRTGQWQTTQCKRTHWRAAAAPCFEDEPVL